MIYYLDHSADIDGDGSSPAQASEPGGVGAWNTLSGKTLLEGDTVWCRRKEGNYTSNLTFEASSIKIIGFPLSGDPYYSTRPQTAIDEGWDSDEDEYCKITMIYDVAANGFRLITGADKEIYRIYLNITQNYAGHYWRGFAINAPCLLYKCYCKQNSSAYIRNAFAILTQSLTDYVKFYYCKSEFVDCSSNSNAGFYMFNNAYVYLESCENVDNETSSWIGIYFTLTSNEYKQYIITNACIFVSRNNYCLYFQADAWNNFLDGQYFLKDSSFDCKTNNRTLKTSGLQGLIYMNNCEVLGGGGIQFDGSGGYYIKLSKFIQNFSMNYGIVTGWNTNGIFLIDNAIFAEGNTDGDISTKSMPILLRNALFRHSTEVEVGTYKTPVCYCLDYQNEKGKWKAWVGANIQYTDDNVKRTGGEDFSICIDKVKNPIIKEELISWIGVPGSETIYALVPSGTNKKITIYGSYKLGSGNLPSKRSLWLEGEYYDLADSTHWKSFSTRAVTALGTEPSLDSDSSEWTGEAVVPFKIEVTLPTVGQESLVPLRLYMSGGFTDCRIYIDPLPIVT